MELTYWPNPVLTTPCRDITEEELKNNNVCNLKLNEIVECMRDKMVQFHGVGLAANQIGLPIRLFIARDDDNEIIAINPKYVKLSGDRSADTEGCLSIPNVNGLVLRHNSVVLEFNELLFLQSTNIISTIRVTNKYKKYMARIIQHEMDHLEGISFIDKMSMRDSLDFKDYLKHIKTEWTKKYGEVKTEL